ncbi:MAG TPA: winged helix DNA-binding domain-containing protein [Solirubrobacteraceae bacterium]|nr:winged helix DNA-binding domain-containing protein [Solirubrobacteraceae bacterium]
MPERVLDRRALNRALLARQHLLHRAELPVAGMLEHLGGMQAQEPQAPFVGLWSRIRDFDPHELDGLLERREAVRLLLMRGTVHLVTARDCLAFRAMVAESLRKRVTGVVRARLDGIGLDEIARLAAPMIEAEPLQSPEVGRRLRAALGAGEPQPLGWAATGVVPAVQLPPRGLWGRTGPALLTTAQRWLGAELAAETAPDALVLRHLAAFGPATTSDIRMWSGVTGVREAVARLRPRLVSHADERGRELLDLPGMPLPDPDTPAPVRFLPEFDNAFLAHADRTRIIADEHKPLIVAGTRFFLVDGFAAGTWRVEDGVVRAEPFGAPAREHAEALAAEGERLTTFLASARARGG